MAHPSPPLCAVERSEDRVQGHDRDGGGRQQDSREFLRVGGRAHHRRAPGLDGWEDARIIGERQVLMVVAYKGQLYLLSEHRPAKFENIDTQGLHEAGYGPDDFE